MPDGEVSDLHSRAEAQERVDRIAHFDVTALIGEGSVDTQANEVLPVVSPDGRWLAYMSDESGALEVYVQRFPDGGGRQRVSTSGGTRPIWGPDGRELFYVNQHMMMAVSVW